MYKLLNDIEATIPDLLRIMKMLNKPTDLYARMVAEAMVRDHTIRIRKRMSVGRREGALDHIPIVLQDIEFTLTPTAPRFVFAGKAEIPQGKLVGLVGKHGHGKTTLLRLIGASIFTKLDNGSCFVPSHLRTLHVSMEPMFFDGTLADNLTFGVESASDKDPQRIKSILKKLYLDSVEDNIAWIAHLTFQQRYLVHLARAIIANPHVLCLHKPTMVHSDNHTIGVLRVLREFVDKRGVEQDPVTQESRRPRTCIFTSHRFAPVREADMLYNVSDGKIEQIELKDFVEEM